ncbi:MAG: preprotein translocase subunit YajC [Kiritimatiellae bacterium]|nr:preprotein translocase subunit YajC [Kiritimatiellia bacterium]
MLVDLITFAMAASPGEGGTTKGPGFMLGWVAIMFAIMYFILFRPQQRKEKERRSLLKAIKTGDRVVFSGGIIGSIANVKDKTFTIKVADKVKIEVSRGAVTQVLDKDETPDETSRNK